MGVILAVVLGAVAGGGAGYLAARLVLARQREADERARRTLPVRERPLTEVDLARRLNNRQGGLLQAALRRARRD